MTQVILQPTSNDSARKHYVDTIENPVSISSIKKYLNDDIKHELIKSFPSGLIFLWGLTPGQNGININKWKKINQGDIVLFARDKKIYSSGTVVSRFQNPDLAKHLWSVDNKKSNLGIYVFSR